MKKKHGNNSKHNNKDDENDDRVATTTTDDLFIICGENSINVACDETNWVVDSGAYFHVTPNKDFFASYTPGNFWDFKDG